ncbi:MAG: hypothetical protein AB2A00_14370 [Myxococcota bacterium]
MTGAPPKQGTPGAPTEAAAPAVMASGKELAIQFMAAFQKTVRSANLYARNNQLLAKFHHDTFNMFTALSKERGDLEFGVRADRLTLGGEVVLQDGDRESGIPFRLYREGIRRLTLEAGMTPPEMHELVAILGAPSRTSSFEEDLVTMLWKANLQHVKYVTVDISSAAYTTPGAAAQETQEQESDQDAAVRRELDALLGAIYQGGRTPAGGEDAVRGLSISVDDLLALKALGNERQGELETLQHATSRDIVTVDEPRLEAIRKELSDESDAALTDRALDVMLNVLFRVKSGAESRKVLDQLVALFDSLLVSRDFRTAAGLVDRVRSHASSNPSLTDPNALKNLTIVRQLMKVFTGEQRLTAVAVALNETQQQAGTSMADLARLLTGLGQDSPASLLTMLSGIQNPQHRRLLCDVVLGIGLPPASVLAPYVNHSEWFVGRDVLYLLGHSKEEEAQKLVLESCGSQHPRLRQTAVSMLGRFPPGAADAKVLVALTDADAGVRQVALKVAAQRHLTAAVEVLKTVISNPGFEERDLAEIRSFLMAYAMLGGEDAVAALDRILNPPLLQKGAALLDRLRNSVDAAADSQKVDLRIAAAAALGAIDSPAATGSLQKGAKSVIPAVKAACLKALNKGVEPTPAAPEKKA